MTMGPVASQAQADEVAAGVAALVGAGGRLSPAERRPRRCSPHVARADDRR